MQRPDSSKFVENISAFRSQKNHNEMPNTDMKNKLYQSKSQQKLLKVSCKTLKENFYEQEKPQGGSQDTSGENIYKTTVQQ